MIKQARQRIEDYISIYPTQAWNIGLGVVISLICLIYGRVLVQGSSSMLLIWVGLPFGILFVILAFIKPEFIAVVLFVARWSFIPDTLERTMGINSPVPLITFLLVGIVVIQRMLGRRLLVSDRLLWWVGGFIAILSAGLWYAEIPDLVTARLTDIRNDFLIGFSLINLITTRRDLIRAMYLMMVIGSLLATLTVIQEATKNYDEMYYGLARTKIAQITVGMDDRPRAGGPMGEPIVYGQIMLMVTPIGFWAMTRGKRLGRILGGYAAITSIAAIGITFTRGVYLALLAVLILYAIYIRLKPSYLLVIIPLLLGAWQFAPPEIAARFQTLDALVPGDSGGEGVYSDSSFRGRYTYLVLGIQMFIDHPIIGLGAQHFKVTYPVYLGRYGGVALTDEERNAHNLYLEVLTEQGLIGFIVFLGMFATAHHNYLRAYQFFKKRNDDNMANLMAMMEISLAGYMAASVFMHGSYQRYLWLQITLAIIVSVMVRRIEKEERVTIDTPAVQTSNIAMVAT